MTFMDNNLSGSETETKKRSSYIEFGNLRLNVNDIDISVNVIEFSTDRLESVIHSNNCYEIHFLMSGEAKLCLKANSVVIEKIPLYHISQIRTAFLKQNDEPCLEYCLAFNFDERKSRQNKPTKLSALLCHNARRP